MIHAITLGLFLVLVVDDALLDTDALPLIKDLSSLTTVLLSTLPFLALWAIVHAVLLGAGRALDRAGSSRALKRALRVLSLARIATLLLFAVAVLGLGWLRTVRATIGDLVLADEALALLPPIATLALLWWSYYPIERRLREATVLAALDGTRVVPGLPTRLQYVTDQARLHLLLVLIPLFALTIWWESLARALEWASRILDRAGDDALVLYNLACLYSLAGEVSSALDALERSYAAGLADPDWMNQDSDLDNIRSHARYAALVARMEAGA